MALIQSKEMVHFPHLGGFKLTKLGSKVPDLADPLYGSHHSIELKVIAKGKKETMHVIELKWDHNSNTVVVSVLTTPSHKV